jgi:hypothetical protein
MFLPSSAYLTPIEPIERDRLKAGRPASRTEILDRHLRERRINAAAITHDQTLRTEAATSVRPAQTPPVSTAQTAPISLARVRRGISRALITAGERIGPEAA